MHVGEVTEDSEAATRAHRTLALHRLVRTVRTRSPLRLALYAVLVLIVAFVVADVLGLRESDTGVRSPLGYVGIPHGGHTHYVPNGWDGENISAYPTAPPDEGMTVAPGGQVVPR